MRSVYEINVPATIRLLVLLVFTIPSPELGVALMAGYTVWSAGLQLEERLGVTQVARAGARPASSPSSDRSGGRRRF